MNHARSAVFVAISLLILLASCATPAPEEEPITIAFACRDYQRDLYQALAQAFHEDHPSIDVQIRSIDEITGNPPGVVTSDDPIEIASAADTFVGYATGLGDTPPQNVVLDLSELATQDETFDRDDFYEGVLGLFQSQGKLWGLPESAHARVVFYNPKLFDAANVPYPQIGWSWDDFVEAASRLTIREGGTVQQYGYMDTWPGYALVSLAYQRAGSLIEREQDVVVAHLDEPGVAEAVAWYADLVRTHAVMPDLTTMDDRERQRFAYEQSPAMWAGGTYEIDNFRALYGAGVVPFPEAGPTVASVSAQGYFVSAGTAHPEAAWRWIEFLTRQSSSLLLGTLPVRKSVADQHWKTVDEEVAAVGQHVLEHAVDYPPFVWVFLGRALEEVLSGASTEAALATAQDKVSASLAAEAEAARRPPTPIAVATPAPSPTPGGTRVRFSLYYDVDPTAYRGLVDQFQQEHPGIAVEILPMEGRTIRERAAAADCFVHHAGSLYVEDTDALLSLDPMVAEDEFELGVFSAFLEDVQVDGELWALPLETDASLLYYNRDLFDGAGVPYPSEEWTPQEWIARAVELTDAGAAEPVYGFYPRDGAYASAPASIVRLGGRLFDADGHPTFDHPSVIAALSAYADLVLQASPPAARERGDARWPAYGTWWGAHPGTSGSGSIATWVDLRENHLTAPPLDFPVGVVPIPGGNVSTDVSTLHALFISAKTPHPDACWAWIAFLSEQEGAVSLFPARQDIATSDAWRERVGSDTADAWLSLLERGKSARLPWNEDWDLRFSLYWLDAALAEVLDGAPPIAALAEAQVKASTFLECVSASEEEAAWQDCARQADPDVALPEE
jgi:ABC-type glycerol-3-phosphate transport system substrate-binding protein